MYCSVSAGAGCYWRGVPSCTSALYSQTHYRTSVAGLCTAYEQHCVVLQGTTTSWYCCGLRAFTNGHSVTQIVVSNHTSVVAVPQSTQYMFRVKSTRCNTEILDYVFFDKKAQEKCAIVQVIKFYKVILNYTLSSDKRI